MSSPPSRVTVIDKPIRKSQSALNDMEDAMRLHTPAQLEALTGLTTGSQRMWRQNILQGRGMVKSGGHSRFRNSDVLFVALTRAVGDMGLPLLVAANVADLCMGEVANALRRQAPYIPSERTHPYVFVWRLADTNCDGALQEVGSFSEVGDTGFCVYRLADLNRIPAFSQAGGFVLIPADLANRIPRAVADLFREAE